ncbi:MAG: hypothetical protein VX642_04325 [Bdellovibrionota bacterium]|nr:hypothetical protein [Bdellovibrionota bacterium]
MADALEFVESEFGPIPVLNGRRLASKRKPLAEARSWVERQDRKCDEFIVFGFGAGFHIDELKKTKDAKSFLIFEINLEIAEFAKTKGYEVITNKEELLNIVEQSFKGGFQVLFHQASIQQHTEEYEEALFYLSGRNKEGLERALNRISLSLDSKREMENKIFLDRELVNYSKALPMDRNYNLLNVLAEILK